jgi:uridine kinase
MYLIGIAGGSGSGKTTFAKKILNKVHQDLGTEAISEVVLMSQDSYYLSAPNPTLKIGNENNFDHPEAFDWPLLRDHLSRLKTGEQIPVPVYDYKISRRTEEVTKIGPSKVVLLEGIYTLWDQELRDLFDVKVFLHVDADIRFIRRLHRDVKERGRTHDEIVRRYYDTVRPMHLLYLEPTAQFADLVVGEETDIAARILADHVKELVKSEATH